MIYKHALGMNASLLPVILGIFVVIVLLVRLRNIIADEADYICLPVSQQLDGFLAQACRRMGEPDNDHRRIELWSQACRIVCCQDGRGIEDHALVRIVNVTQKLIETCAKKNLSRIWNGGPSGSKIEVGH